METGNRRFCIEDGSERTFQNVWSSWKRDFTIDSLDTGQLHPLSEYLKILIVISFLHLTSCKFLYLREIEKLRN